MNFKNFNNNQQNKMNTKIPDILKEKSNKLFFLKAILLGIQYGQSDNSKNYIDMISSEISTLENNNQNSLKNNSLSSVSPNILMSDIKNNDINEKKSSIQLNNQLLIQNEKLMNSIQKYEEIISSVENQKLQLQSTIQNITNLNYRQTLSRNNQVQNMQQINLLKAQIMILNKQIEKYTLLIHHTNKLIQENNNKNSNNISSDKNNIPKSILKSNSISFTSLSDNNSNNSNISNISNKDKSPIGSMGKFVEKIDDHQSYINEMNNNDYNNDQDDESNNNEDMKEDFLKELQKTFGSLSSLLIQS